MDGPKALGRTSASPPYTPGPPLDPERGRPAADGQPFGKLLGIRERLTRMEEALRAATIILVEGSPTEKGPQGGMVGFEPPCSVFNGIDHILTQLIQTENALAELQGAVNTIIS